MVTYAYVALVTFVALQRLLESRISALNEAELRARGAVEHAAQQTPFMVAMHTSWLVTLLVEVLEHDRPFLRALALPALLVFCVGQLLRLAAIQALGPRWTIKVITLPGEPPISGGIFRYLRHPNYLGVVLEIAALPLIHGAWFSALLFSVMNAVLLWLRIRAEESALAEASDYHERFRARPRFWPKLARQVGPGEA